MQNDSPSTDHQAEEEKALFDNPKNVKRVMYFLYASCVLLLLLDFVIHRHVVHSWENLWGFYPLYGFVGCVVLVLVATWMRTFLMRPENYYESFDQADSKPGSPSHSQPDSQPGSQPHSKPHSKPDNNE